MHKSNLSVVFMSILVGNKKQNLRRKNMYETALQSIERILNSDTEIVVVENTGYFNINPREGAFLNHKILQLENNTGKSNKGVGELDMLLELSKYINFEHYNKVFYLTGRYFYANPFLFNYCLNSTNEIFVAKPKFHGLDGKINEDGMGESFNDMFFCMTGPRVCEYVEFFSTNRDKMIKNNIPSEALLFNFVSQLKSNNEIKLEILKHIGLIRLTTNRIPSIREIQIL